MWPVNGPDLGLVVDVRLGRGIDSFVSTCRGDRQFSDLVYISTDGALDPTVSVLDCGTTGIEQ